DAVQGARGWTLAPEHVDQPVRRNRSAAMEEEHREERALLGTAECDRLSVLVHIERAEDSEVDHRIDPGSPAARNNIAITRHIKRRSTLPQGSLKPQIACSPAMSSRHGLVVVLAVSAIVAPAAHSGARTPVSPSQP